MKTAFESFVVAFSMYSKIPMPRVDWNDRNMKYAICFFPLIGVPIGACLYGWFYLAGRLGLGDLLRTCVLVLIPVLITGGIHLDGLLDTADALSSYKSREEKLEILKDSHAGAFAIIVGICYFVLALGIWSEAAAEDLIPAGLCFLVSRSLSGLALVCFPKAKGSGLLRTFSDAASNRFVILCMTLFLLATGSLLIVTGGASGVAALCLAGVTFGWYYAMSKRKFGGITGDLAGFFLQICELVMAAGVILL